MQAIDHHAAPLILNADAIRPHLPQLPVRQVLLQLFAALGQGLAVQPAQTLTLFPGDAGDVITYQGVLASQQLFGAKLSPYIVTGGKPLVTAWTSLFSMQTGQPLLFCDASLLTVERTAGTTALAVELLARPDSQQLALIGCGAVGQAHLRHVLALRPWTRIRVFAPGLAADRALLDTLLAIDNRIELATSAEDAAADADVVMLCTSSGSPVLDVAALRRPALITSISTNVAQAHEIAPAKLPQLDVYCDHRASTPSRAGEMVLAARDHQWQADAIRGDLAELVSERCPRPDYQRHVFFRSIGMGLQDIAIAHALLQRVQQAG